MRPIANTGLERAEVKGGITKERSQEGGKRRKLDLNKVTPSAPPLDWIEAL
jgi:hypothetical protein